METIYSITSDKGDKVYIGRTKQKIEQRQAGHKYYEKTHNNCSSQELFDDYGFENCIFTVLEECVEEQGAERERYHIQNTPNVVNIRLPGRNASEWYKDHRERQKERSNAYAQANKERIKEYKKAYHQAKKKALQ